MTTVFLSYARGDDEAFAKRVYADLTNAGFEVWRDRESLHSISLTFHQQIKDAIHKQIDRMIYIAGPKAAVSDYVREEWKFALECDKPVIPVLRLGDYNIVPGELSLLHCDDFRDDGQYPARLAKLIANLKRPEPPLGKLHAVPSLPRHFLGRPDLLRKLMDAVLVDLQKPVVISGAEARVGVQGMGGIGKSVVAAALARDREVRRSYPDGVIWVSLGQKPEKEEVDKWLVGFQRDVARMLGSQAIIESEAQGRVVLQKLLADKAVFLVLDDVWEARHAAAFDVLGPRCRALITTRDAGILHAMEGVLHQVELFSESEALQLLSDAVDLTPSELPPEASTIVKECGCLPLAVALCGGMARGGIRWSSILERLRRADLDKIADRNAIHEQHRNIYRAMLASVEVLEPDQQRRFAELAVFPTDQTIPEAAVATLWQHTNGLDDLDTEALLVNFSERSLIRLDKAPAPVGGTADRRISMHDLLHDLATKLAGEPRTLHRILLDAYRGKCPDGWPSGPNDGYFLQSLCSHLIAAEGADDAVALLTDLPWVEAKCQAGLVFDLQEDYRDALNALPEMHARLQEEQQQRARAARWTADLISYSQAWSERRDRIARNEPVDETEPVLPEIPTACRIWTDEEIETECRRIRETPTRLDRLAAFAGFVQGQCYPLIQFGGREGFVVQHAFNYAPGGPVHDAAAGLLPRCAVPLMLSRWPRDVAWSPKPALLRTLEGHAGVVESVSVMPDGRRAVSGSGDKTLRVWDLETGACLRPLEGHGDRVLCVSVTPDGRRAVSGSGDKTLRVWDLESGQCLRTLTGHSDWVWAANVTADGRCAVSGSKDDTLRVWNLDSGRCLRTLTAPVRSVSVTSDGRRAVSGSSGVTFDGRGAVSGSSGTLRIWDLESGACLRTMKGHRGEVFSVSVTSDGRRAVSGSSDNALRIWDLESGQCLGLAGPANWVHSVSMTPDGRRAVSGGHDKTVRVWDLESGQCLRTLTGHSTLVGSVGVTSDGQCAVSGSSDNTLRVWDLATGQCSRTLGHRDRVTCVTPARQRLVSASGDGTLRVWDVENGQCLLTLGGHSRWVGSVSVTWDGRRAVSGSWDKTVRVWDLGNGQCERTLVGHRDAVLSVQVTPDGRRVVSGSKDNTLRVWDLESGQCLRTLTGHSDEVLRMNVTPDGRCGVSGSKDNTLRVWELESGECLRTLTGHSDEVWSVNVTPDGRRVVSGSKDNTLRVWDLESGQCLRTLTGHSGWVFEVSVMQDGRRAVSGSWDNTLRVWDLESGQCLRTLTGHSERVYGLSVTADCHRVVSGSTDKTVRVWDLETGACLGLFAAGEWVGGIAICSELLTLGTGTGQILFVEMHDLPSGPAIAIDTSDVAYEASLRRGLEFSRRHKGPDYEETLAHLKALATHLERMGKADEARALREEHDRLAAVKTGK